MSSNTAKTVEVYSLFDLTATGLTHRDTNIRYPYITSNGYSILDANEFSIARNQQRNFDTILQLASLRTQLFNIKDPEIVKYNKWPKKKVWKLVFEIESCQWQVGNDDLALLKHDSNGTPMIIGLTESPNIDALTMVFDDQKPHQNSNSNLHFLWKIDK